jgi:hypothetical protein
LALAFFVGATVQMSPSSMTTEEISLRTGVAGGGAGLQPPCGDHMPNCVDHVGCITVSALPASPGSEAVAFEWTPLDYDLASESLSGICLKPELSPSILPA